MKTEPGRTDAHAGTVVVFGCTADMSNIFFDGVVQELDARGWVVHAVSSPGPVAARVFGDSARRHELPMQRGIAPLRDVVSLVRWVRLLRRLRPAVLVLGTPKASLLGALAARLTGVRKVVYFVLGLRAELTSGVLARILSTAERLTLRSASRIIAISPSLRSEVEAAHPRFSGRVDVLGHGGINGVDLSRFTPPSARDRRAVREHWGLSPDALVAGFVGRLHPDKGGSFLLDLLDAAPVRELGLHLLVIGDIEDDALRARCEPLEARGRITVTGWVDAPEQHMAALDILLHPTKREGLGMVLLEAQAMQIPVVTNRVTGTVDSVNHGVGGYFAATDSVSDWAERVAALARDGDERSLAGRRGREFVADRFARQRVVTDFADYVTGLAP